MKCLEIAALALQLIGLLVVLGAAWRSARKMGTFKTEITYEELGPFLKFMRNEIGGQFVTQAWGVALAATGMVLQFFAS